MNISKQMPEFERKNDIKRNAIREIHLVKD